MEKLIIKYNHHFRDTGTDTYFHNACQPTKEVQTANVYQTYYKRAFFNFHTGLGVQIPPAIVT